IGVDFSAEVGSRLGAYVEQREDLRHVELRQGLAHDLSFVPDDSCDLVILNSVIQYFPDLDYLLKVLSEAVRITKEGGHIFVGDARSLPLLEAYHASVQLHKAPDELSIGELQQRVRQAHRNEEELAVDPGLFAELGRRWAKVGRVQSQLKVGSYNNELSRFRYDVTLRIGAKEAVVEPQRWLMWDEAGQWEAELEKELTLGDGHSVGLREVRDGRVASAVQAVRLLQSPESAPSNARQRPTPCAKAAGADPDAVMRVAARLEVPVDWQGFTSSGDYEVVFRPQWVEQPALGEAPGSHYKRYVNEPARSAGDARLGRKLREDLREKLPEYLVPGAIIMMTSWPLSPNGKIDRRALPSPQRHREELYRAPRTPQEEMLCEIFAEVLGLERAGIDENFFELGGHSLMATRLVSRVRARLGVELPIRMLFESPTIAELVPRLRLADNADSTLNRALPLRSGGNLPPLFCLPPGSGHSWVYTGLLDKLSADRPIYGLQSSGLAAGETFPSSIEEIVDGYTTLIRKIQPTGPYHLLG